MAGWKGESHEAEQVCQKMLNDLKINKSLPADRWDISYESEIDDEKFLQVHPCAVRRPGGQPHAHPVQALQASATTFHTGGGGISI